MRLLKRLSKPHYLYRPSQLIRRARLPRGASEAVVETPWHCRLLVELGDAVGAGIARTGVHELAVSETMWRLAGGDELAIDVGANIGYFTGLLARRAQRVVAVEPNPRLRRLLSGNIARWDGLAERIELDLRAASSENGTARLYVPAEFAGNYGTASLDQAADAEESFEVETVRLDEVVAGRAVGVMKIDVEGHELAALQGASESLRAGLIRDVIFESHEPPPTPVSELLQRAGFAIAGIEETLTHPRLLPPGRVPQGWDAPTYLATRDMPRARRLLSARGWACLGRGGH